MRTQVFSALLMTAVIALTACGGSNTGAVPDESAPATESSAEPPVDNAEAPASEDHSAATKGGQVVETGAYHMELVPVPEGDGIHLDLYLQTGDTHAPVAGAAAVAQVQLPDGTQQEIPMEYDAAGEHFFAFIPSQATGEYKTVIQTDIQGEKVNGRFSFSK